MPATCTLLINRRYFPSETFENVVGKIKAAVERGLEKSVALDAKVDVFHVYPAMRKRADGPHTLKMVGDAFGAPLEGYRSVSDADIERVMQGDAVRRYTDDTHMTIAMAESLVERNGFDGEHMARTFAQRYAAEPWRGYGSGPPRIFARIMAGELWHQPARELFNGSGSYGNGAAMRVVPAALFASGDAERAIELARQTGAITHTHALGLAGAALQAAAIALLLQVQGTTPLNPEAFLDDLSAHVEDERYVQALAAIRSLLPHPTSHEVAATLGNGIAAHEAVPAALCAFLRALESFDETIRFSFSLGGDVDTIAAMAGALSGAYLGEDAIGESWTRRTEGVQELRRLADRLLRSTTER